MVAGFGAAIDRAATAGLVVHPKTRWKKGESVRTGWRASRATVLEVVDLGRLGDLMAELSAAGAAISGPAWHLDPTNPVHGHVRRLAAEDARRRAEVYAAALGLEIVAVAWVAEPGLRKDSDHQGFDVPTAMRMAAAPGPMAEDVINVTPAEMTVNASVEVGFAFGPAARRVIRAPRRRAVPMVSPMSENRWPLEEHAQWYLSRADSIPHRTEGEAELLALLPPTLGRVLDLGCGDGRLMALVRAARPGAWGIAMDFSPTMLAAASEQFAGSDVEVSTTTSTSRCPTWDGSRRWCPASPSITSTTGGSRLSTRRFSTGCCPAARSSTWSTWPRRPCVCTRGS